MNSHSIDSMRSERGLQWIRVGVSAVLWATIWISFVSTAQAQRGDLDTDELQNAKDAYALLFDNQTRCMNLASTRLSLVEDGQHAVDQFADEASSGELEVAFRSLRISNGLIAASTPKMPIAGKILTEMQDAQIEVCTLSGSGSENGLTRAAFEFTVQSQNTLFDNAERKLSRILPVSASEMQEILSRYRDELYGSRRSGRRSGSRSGTDPIASRKITAKEYQKKKEAYEDWRAEQARIERWKLEKEQERREYLEEQQRQGLDQPTPEVGLKGGVPPRSSYEPIADPAQMARWQSNFTTKLGPFRIALTEYLKLKHGTRKLLQDACWKFSEESRKLTEDQSVVTSPDARLGPKVKTALTSFQQAGLACVRTSPDAAKPLMRKGEAGLGDVADLLKAYRLSF